MKLIAVRQKYFADCLERNLHSNSLGEKQLQCLIKDLEKCSSKKRLNLYQAQDEVDEKRENCLAKVEAMLAKKIEQTKLITFHWRIL